MKKTKKVLAAILSAIILLAALPMGAYAAESAISSAEFEINVAPGININDWESFLTVNTNGLIVDGVCVYDYYGYPISGENEAFEMGMEYYICFYIMPEEGYKFPDSEFELETVTVNGEGAEFYLYATGENEDQYDLMEVCYSTIIGGELTEIALELDVYGEFGIENYYRYIKFISGGIDFMYSTKDVVLVYDENGNIAKGNFEAGCEYTFKIFLSPKDSCNFRKNDEGEFELDSVTVNGKEVAYSISSYETNSYYEYIAIEATVTAEEVNIIKDIDIDISTDLANVYVEDWENYVTINTKGLELDDDNGDPAVFAYDIYDNFVEQYLPGETYYLYVYFTPEDGYVFPEYYVFDSIIVNGEYREDIDDFGVYTSENGKEIYYIGIEFITEVEPEYNLGFFGRIISFFQSIIEWFSSLFFFVTI